MKYTREYVGHGCNCKTFYVAENGWKIRRDAGIDMFTGREMSHETRWAVINDKGEVFGSRFLKLAEAKEFLESVSNAPEVTRASHKTYNVRYKMEPWETERSIDVIASNKFEAYDKAAYEVISYKEGRNPYSAWVASVTYNNGRYHRFDTFEGLPY